jgi:hypothetical protein
MLEHITKPTNLSRLFIACTIDGSGSRRRTTTCVHDDMYDGIPYTILSFPGLIMLSVVYNMLINPL